MSLRLVLTFVAPVTVAFALSGAASAMTAEELVAKNLAARGGAEKLRAITSMHTVGKVRAGGGLDAKVETWAVSPHGFRGEFSLQGMTAVQAWDGKDAWSISPFQGRKDPQKLSPDDAKAMIEGADVAGPLVDYQAKGNTIEYLGTEDIFDPDQFLEIRVVNHRMVRGQEEVSTTDLGEYEKVDGIYFPFESGRSHLDKVELNPTLDPKLFAFPGGVR
jgi:outer membrane lipoprotein-sorting protein